MNWVLCLIHKVTMEPQHRLNGVRYKEDDEPNVILEVPN